MMARVKVKVERGNGLQQVVVIDTAATQGARLGRDVYLPDGAVATPASMRNWMGVSQGTAAPTAGSSLQSVLTNKGDLATRNSQVQRLGIGTQDQALRVSSAGLPEWRSGAALTKQDDANVTLTLNGEPGNALLDGVELELGWDGTLAPERGGWGADISAADGYAKFTAGVAAFSNTVPWGDIDGTPDTLAGYGITDAYTMAQVDALFTDMENYFLPDNYQPLSATLTDLAMLGDAEGVLTNDGYGNLSWGSGGSTYTAGDGLDLAGDEFSVDESFAFNWSAQHTFGVGPHITGAIGALGASRMALDYNATSRIHSFGANSSTIGGLEITARSSNNSVTKNILDVAVSGGALAGFTYGNSTDEPLHTFYGVAEFRGDPSSSAFLARAYSPSSTAYMQALSGASNGSVGFAATNGTRTWYMYHTGSALAFDTGGTRALLGASGEWSWAANVWHKDLSGGNRFYFGLGGRTYFGSPITGGNVAYEWRDGGDNIVAQLRADGWFKARGIISRDDMLYREMAINNADLTYGSAYVSGASNGWSGLAIYDGALYPTFMSNGTGWGLYQQGGSAWWSYYAEGGYTASPSLHHDTAFTQPYMRVMTGGAQGGGKITISTSAPSGTPADGDIWIQRAA